MTTPKDDTPPTEGPPREVTTQDRRVQMLDLWGATLSGLKSRLEADVDAGELTASFYDTVVGFLRDSAINAETVTEAKDAIDDMHTDLVAQIEEIKADQEAGEDFTPKKKEKASTVKTADVVPLHQPFTPRPPR